MGRLRTRVLTQQVDNIKVRVQLRDVAWRIAVKPRIDVGVRKKQRANRVDLPALRCNVERRRAVAIATSEASCAFSNELPALKR